MVQISFLEALEKQREKRLRKEAINHKQRDIHQSNDEEDELG